MTSQPDHSLADEPMVDEPLPDDSRPTASVTPEPLPAEPLPAEPLPAEPLPAEPMPAEPLPAEAASSARPTYDPDVLAASGRRFNDLPEPSVIGGNKERAGDTELAGGADLEDDTELAGSADLEDDTELADSPDLANDTELAGDADVGMRTTAASVAPGRLTGQWHDIQAMFVDDPQGSVQRAAQVTEAAVTALADSLRQRHAALVPADTSIGASNTEQLRAALVDYRVFYDRLAGLAEQLTPEQPTTEQPTTGQFTTG